jgi:hypothetical protein
MTNEGPWSKKGETPDLLKDFLDRRKQGSVGIADGNSHKMVLPLAEQLRKIAEKKLDEYIPENLSADILIKERPPKPKPLIIEVKDEHGTIKDKSFFVFINYEPPQEKCRCTIEFSKDPKGVDFVLINYLDDSGKLIAHDFSYKYLSFSDFYQKKGVPGVEFANFNPPIKYFDGEKWVDVELLSDLDKMIDFIIEKNNLRSAKFLLNVTGSINPLFKNKGSEARLEKIINFLAYERELVKTDTTKPAWAIAYDVLVDTLKRGDFNI